MKPIVMEVDVILNTIINREMTDEEFAQYLLNVAAWEAQQAQELSID